MGVHLSNYGRTDFNAHLSRNDVGVSSELNANVGVYLQKQLLAFNQMEISLCKLCECRYSAQTPPYTKARVLFLNTGLFIDHPWWIFWCALGI